MGFPAPFVVTYTCICFSDSSTDPRGPASPVSECSPTDGPYGPSHSFGTGLMPDYYPRGAARLVSCYALFE